MARQIDTDAVINSIRLAEQAGDVATIAAGFWQLYAKETGLYLEDDAEIVGGPLGTAFEPGGRLTLTTATPVTTADVTAAATLYYTPYKHNMISLYDGARWIPKTFTELSLSLVGYTASKPYDIWAYLNAGAVALESTVWTDGTTRATALARQDGRYVKNGAATRLYLGTIYINSSGAQTDDSVTKRTVWNYYNRVNRNMQMRDANPHNYTTGTYRSWNGDDAIRLQVMVGVVEEPITLTYGGMQETSAISVGYDVTNADSSGGRSVNQLAPTAVLAAFNTWNHYPGVGFHFYQLVEYGAAGATQTNGQVDAVIRG